jgi:Tol biopolymer transport system component
MSFTPGGKLGSYEILAQIGAGGMGEVYRAKDARLGREVALKVLPQAFARDAERMARFEREAKVLASLNHPNIATIHGLEESGSTRALVMELVEGPTLAERIKSGAIPLDEAFPIARQIAEGLEYAHERGIVHRDLKPSNVKMTPDGHVKILDFGLAKALEGDLTEEGSQNSPTLTVAATRAGVLLGTAAYMAPEQARGKRVDRRADIWAFGCVLYELLTGQRAFTGETTSDTLAAIITRDPDWSLLPANTPARIRDLLRRCLQKDPRQRVQAVGDARIAIEEAMTAPVQAEALGGAAGVPPEPASRRVLPWAFAAALSVALGFALNAWWKATRPADQPLMRFELALTPAERIGFEAGSPLAISPEGTHLAYVVRHGDTTQLYMRALDRVDATPVSGTDGAYNPFFSPDGQLIAFFVGAKMKRASVAGGPATTICDVSGIPRGASWGVDGNIYAALTATGGLVRVSSSGGTPEPLTSLDPQKNERTHRWPQVLPDGKNVLFTVGRTDSPEYYDDSEIDAVSVATGKRKMVLQGASMALYVPTGHLLYARGGQLFAVPFDPTHLEVTGTAVPVLQNVTGDPSTGAAYFSVSNRGSLVYVPGSPVGSQAVLAWADRTGAIEALSAPPHAYRNISLSPDGQHVAMGIPEGRTQDIWIANILENTLNRLTFEGENQYPIWTPDGKRVIYSSNTGGRQYQLKSVPADGSSAPETLLNDISATLVAGSVSPDEKLLAYTSVSGGNPRPQLWLLPLVGERKPAAFVPTGAALRSPTFSPDGRWLAYAAEEADRLEVYVEPCPRTGGRWQVSTGGGDEPRWSRDGKQLFYRAGSALMVVPIETKTGFKAGTPQTFLAGLYRLPGAVENYSVSPDGRRVLMLRPAGNAEAVTRVVVVVNWFDELGRLTATAAK